MLHHSINYQIVHYRIGVCNSWREIIHNHLVSVQIL